VGSGSVRKTEDTSPVPVARAGRRPVTARGAVVARGQPRNANARRRPKSAAGIG
jgi:hypothetical protein